jgi:hypothetical protein
VGLPILTGAGSSDKRAQPVEVGIGGPASGAVCEVVCCFWLCARVVPGALSSPCVIRFNLWSSRDLPYPSPRWSLSGSGLWLRRGRRPHPISIQKLWPARSHSSCRSGCAAPSSLTTEVWGAYKKLHCRSAAARCDMVHAMLRLRSTGIGPTNTCACSNICKLPCSKARLRDFRLLCSYSLKGAYCYK